MVDDSNGPQLYIIMHIHTAGSCLLTKSQLSKGEGGRNKMIPEIFASRGMH